MRPNAFSLVELLLVVAILGLLAAIGLPSLRHAADQAAVRSARATLVRALDAARGAALRRGAVVEVTLQGDAWAVFDPASPDSTSLWTAPGPGREGVVLLGGGAPIGFGSAGIAVGVANRTLVLTRGAARATVVLSRLGRIR
jgi:prepilin-type N-terminal cleavage/methylation domain-containing protein